MAGVAPDAEDRGAERLAACEEVGVLDEREAGVGVDPAREERGDGEEELVDETLGEERAPARVGPPSERISSCPRARTAARIAAPSSRPPAVTICSAGKVEPGGALVGREHDRAGGEGGMGGVDPAAAAQHDDLGVAGAADASPQLARTRRPRRETRGAAVQAPRGEASSVPEPTTTASAQARRRPITNRSAALAPAISLFDPGIDGIAVTPSMLCTKFANTRGPSNPSVPP